MEFVAIDIETSNPDMTSICQIGFASLKNESHVSEWVSVINPKDYFDPINISIHGIDESSAVTAPTFEDIFPELHRSFSESFLSHVHSGRIFYTLLAH